MNLNKNSILERGIVILCENDDESRIWEKIVSSLKSKYPILAQTDFEFVKVTQKKISILNLGKGTEYNYEVIKKLVGQGHLYVRLKKGYQFVLNQMFA